MNHAEARRELPTKTGSATFTIPLQISITIGAPYIGTAPPHRGAAANVESARQFERDSLEAGTFSWSTALSLAIASQVAYASPAQVCATALNNWRMETCDFIDVRDTQCFVASTPRAVLVAFRGTEALGDWLADLNARSLVQSYGAVHRGFFHAFHDVKSQLEAILSPFGTRPVLLTGHSLGGALATVAAAEWRGQVPLAGVYTYGQPRVGNNTFRTFVNRHFGQTFYRFVNDDDIVTRVPPGFRHVGRLFHFNASGDLQDMAESVASGSEQTEPRPLTEAEFDQLRASLLAQRAENSAAGIVESPAAAPELEGFFPSFRDHSLDAYIRKVARHSD